jgi:hypothetical protein
MKVTDWRKKLLAALVAGGLMTPIASRAAGLDVNLVTNGNFESVDLNTTGGYHGPRVLSWTGPSLFAYSHDGSSSSTGVVPDYADGADPPSAGHWYFTPNNTGVSDPTDVHDPNTYFQDIDVSSGATAVAIASGQATFNLSAYMSSYLNDTDFGNVSVDFRNSGGGSLGVATISDPDFGPNNVWSLSSLSGAVPVGTASVRMSLYGTRTAGGAGADGYIDNVDFRISGVPEPTSIALAGGGVFSGVLGFFRRRRRGV